MRAAFVLTLLALAATRAAAQDRVDPVPKALARVGVQEKLDAPLPLALVFKDDAGRDVSLGSYFRPGRPVLLTLNYYRCPMLCTLELNGLVTAMKGLPWTPGDEYDVVTVSFDPRETATLARAKKLSYIEDLGRPSAAAGWNFLTGSRESVEALTNAVGFQAEYDKDTDQYGHAAVVMLITPDGRVARYLYGVAFEPATLKLALRIHLGAVPHVLLPLRRRTGSLHAGRDVDHAGGGRPDRADPRRGHRRILAARSQGPGISGAGSLTQCLRR